jgi:NAD(P)-dependent dehydrogenase (short-subunit alcohol dehydrogenase family)
VVSHTHNNIINKLHDILKNDSCLYDLVYIYIHGMTNQKVAIITGGNSGIGRATAVALAKEWVKVAIGARRAKEGAETAQLVKDAGSESIFVKTDVANEDDVKSLIEKTVKTYGRLDYAFNNAGIEETTMTPLVDQSSDIF